MSADARATRPANVALLVHPGVSWKEGRRYIVALRNLRNARGRLLRRLSPAEISYQDHQRRMSMRILAEVTGDWDAYEEEYGEA